VIRLSGLNLMIDDNDHPLIIKVATLLPSRMQVYFIDNDDYFHPMPDKGLETVLMPEDNDERIMFFTSGVIETVKKLRWQPAIVHCSGWVSALAPVYLRKKYADDPVFRSSKIVYALQPEHFEGTLDPRFIEKLRMADFPEDVLESISSSPVDHLTLQKLAIDHCDAIMQVSDEIDSEILEYAIKSNKPMLPHTASEARKQSLLDFYRSLSETDD
ncbi:MAG: glycogen/starch synthase, partial [Duncaniella sp.]|nr:glycogen/starch synthase [Duncaniella sp.]